VKEKSTQVVQSSSRMETASFPNQFHQGQRQAFDLLRLKPTKYMRKRRQQKLEELKAQAKQSERTKPGIEKQPPTNGNSKRPITPVAHASAHSQAPTSGFPFLVDGLGWNATGVRAFTPWREPTSEDTSALPNVTSTTALIGENAEASPDQSMESKNEETEPSSVVKVDNNDGGREWLEMEQLMAAVYEVADEVLVVDEAARWRLGFAKCRNLHFYEATLEFCSECGEPNEFFQFTQ